MTATDHEPVTVQDPCVGVYGSRSGMSRDDWGNTDEAIDGWYSEATADVRAKVPFLVDQLTERTAERDRARDIAVRLQQELDEEQQVAKTNQADYIADVERAGQAIEELTRLLDQAAAVLGVFLNPRSGTEYDEARKTARRLVAEAKKVPA